MRLANICGRSSLVTSSDALVDISEATGGRFGSNIHECYERWEELLALAPRLEASPGTPWAEIPATDIDSPAPRPRQLFAIGLNYAAHAAEASLAVPEDLTVFTKFLSSITGPHGSIALPPGTVDWEAELVVVIGKGGRDIAREAAWSHVAGLICGQDLSERTLQSSGPAPQYSLAKSHRNFAPMGPLLVTPDEFDDPDALELGCLINRVQQQSGNTSDMVFDVQDIIARLSSVTEMLPGDVIFTGTPPGVGVGQNPQRFLKPGDQLTTYIKGIGEMCHTMV